MLLCAVIMYLWLHHRKSFILFSKGNFFPSMKFIDQARIQGGPRPPLHPRFWGPKIEHFWALFNISMIFFASLRSAYYFFNTLLFQSSNSKIFQPRFTQHMISHLLLFVFSLSFTHFRLLGVHLSLSCF